MFESIHHQNMADYLKGWVGRAGPPSAARQRALRLVERFESRAWNPFAFERALDEAAPGSIRVEQGRPTFDGDGLLEALSRILIRYNQLIDSREVFSTAEAADYLGMAVITLKKAIHDSREIAGAKIGNSLMFTRQELDEFYATPRRPVGRPRKEPLDT